jgi:hypothetical protein
VRSDVKLARLLDSTVSGGFWEERNAKAKVKVNKTIKFHMERAVLDCGQEKKEKIPTKGTKPLQLSFLSGRRGAVEVEKNIARSEDI